MEKYFYKLNTYYPYEGASDGVILIHDKCFSKEEMDNMIIESFLDKIFNKRNEGIFNINHYFEGEYLKTDEEIKENLKEMEKEYPGDWDDITFEEYKKEYATTWWTSFNIELDIYQIMIDKYGFEKLKFQDDILIDESRKVVDPDEEYEEYEEYEECREYKILKTIREKYWDKKNKENSI